MPRLPYIGVTGFMTPEEVWQVLEAVPLSVHRKLMVGVLASSKTMRGIPNKYPHRYPRPEKIAEIFVDHPSTLNLIHFNTKEPDQLLEQMIEVTKLGGPNVHGLQLNVKWPDRLALAKYRATFETKVIVLQCGHGALESVRPGKFQETIFDYYGLADYILVDPSGGLGKPIDPTEAYAYLKELDELEDRKWTLWGKQLVNRTAAMGHGIAGGFSAETLPNLITDKILLEFPSTSIDAEGKLRDVNDDLDIEKAKAYVAKAYEMFGAN